MNYHRLYFGIPKSKAKAILFATQARKLYLCAQQKVYYYRDAKMVKPYNKAGESKKNEIATMFNAVAPRYDFLNHVLSMGIDRYWRRKTINLLRQYNPQTILDVATGTGDFALAGLKLKPRKIVGIDISEGMVAVGLEKIAKKGKKDTISLQIGDSEHLPFYNNDFDAITVGFGVRNFEHLELGLSEMLRVLKPGGALAVLEFSKPERFPVKQLYHFYFKRILPVVGRIISKDAQAYTYLPESVNEFPYGTAFADILGKIGFVNTKIVPVSFGIATIYIAQKK